MFTSLALLNMLIGPMNAFPWVLNGVVEAWISAGRICHLFEMDTSDPQLTNQAFNNDGDEEVIQQEASLNPQEDDVELSLNSARIFWESMENPTLLDINVVINKVIFDFFGII